MSAEKPRNAVHVQIHVDEPRDKAAEVAREVAADPCRFGLHRFAWLTSGGQACYRCGSRRS